MNGIMRQMKAERAEREEQLRASGVPLYPPIEGIPLDEKTAKAAKLAVDAALKFVKFPLTFEQQLTRKIELEKQEKQERAAAEAVAAGIVAQIAAERAAASRPLPSRAVERQPGPSQRRTAAPQPGPSGSQKTPVVPRDQTPAPSGSQKKPAVAQARTSGPSKKPPTVPPGETPGPSGSQPLPAVLPVAKPKPNGGQQPSIVPQAQTPGPSGSMKPPVVAPRKRKANADASKSPKSPNKSPASSSSQ